MLSPAEEIFDVVDEHDRVVAQASRQEVHAKKWMHRAVHVLVWNERGEVFMQKRSMNKDQMPGVWATSASGHVDTGEDYDTAAVRELGEELGIFVDGPADLELLFKHPACRYTGEEFVQVYQLQWDGPMILNPEEIDAGQWFAPDELDAAIHANRRNFAPSFRLLWGVARGLGERAFLGRK